MMQSNQSFLPERPSMIAALSFQRTLRMSLILVLIGFGSSLAAAQTPPAQPEAAPAQPEAAPAQPDAPQAVAADPAPTPTATPAPAPKPATKIKARPKSMAKESRRSKRRKPARAQRGTFTGARLIPFRSQAIRASIGFPDIEIAYHFPYTPEIELIPRLQLAYGRNLSTSPSIMEFGTDARKEVYKKGKWTIAGYASSFIHLNMNEDDPVHYGATSGFGLGLGCPGAIATYAHNSDFDINLGVQIQDIIYMGDNSGLELNIPFSVGFEYVFDKDIRIFQKTEFGPDIYVGEKTELHLRTYLGAGYGF